METLLTEAKISDRERTVLLLAADGLTDKEIASSLGLSLKTIHTYWDRMRLKTGASTRTQVFARFLRIDVSPDGDTRGFNRLFATWEEGVWILRRDGRTVYTNGRIAALFGMSQEELASRSAFEVFGKVDAKPLTDVVQGCTEQSQTIELSIRNKKEGRIWLRLVCTPFAEEGQLSNEVVLLVSDITVAKRVQYALDSCDSMLGKVTDISSDRIARFDAELLCTYANPTYLNDFKLTSKDIEGKKLRQLTSLFTPTDLWTRGLEEAIATSEPQEFISPATSSQLAAKTWLIPDPSVEFAPASVLTLTRFID